MKNRYARTNVRIASPVPRRIAGMVGLALLFLGVTLVSGCDANYMPLCAQECVAGGGDETISRQVE